ncbi:rhomboid family intramembrane serine protease [bacterium]|nr:rhomboid family intramembrane serine protease [bacterium]
MSQLREELKQYFDEGPVSKLMMTLIGVFGLIALLQVVQLLTKIPFADAVLRYLVLPAAPESLLWKPWTLLTYNLVHEGFLHLLFNVLYLFFAGRLFVDFVGAQRFIPTFLLGGLAGGLFYVLCYNLFPYFAPVLHQATNRGASAGVMAILFGLTAKVPGLNVRLFFVLDVKLWMIALLLLLLDLAYLPEGNAGGHLAHLGGAAFGYVSVQQLGLGRDWTSWLTQWWGRRPSGLRRRRRGPLSVVKGPGSSESVRTPKPSSIDQTQLDALLDKISRSGYDSLSPEEKELLFRMSQK